MKLKLHWQILIALGLAVIAGLLFGADTEVFGIPLIEIYAFIGKLFLNALKMLIVPLVVSAVVTGMFNIGSSAEFGRLGAKTFGYYIFSSFSAIMIGILMIAVWQPGIVDGQPAKESIGLHADTEKVTTAVEGKGADDLVGIILRMVPTNILEAGTQNDMLALIFFSLLFGFFAAQIKAPHGETLRQTCVGVFDVMMLITNWTMKFSPIGVFGLVAKTVATTGLAGFIPLLNFFFAVLSGLLLHFLIVLPLLVWSVTRANPYRIYRAFAPALLTAFSTSSSSATVPVSMKCIEENAGVSNRTSSFVIPLGATVNMDGTALYECVAALFIAQAYGLELTFAMQFTVVLLALLTSIGVAGIPSASLVAIAMILGAIGLPPEGIGLILAVDRILDMCRTSVNVFSDACGAVIVARLEGEREVLQNNNSRSS